MRLVVSSTEVETVYHWKIESARSETANVFRRIWAMFWGWHMFMENERCGVETAFDRQAGI